MNEGIRLSRTPVEISDLALVLCYPRPEAIEVRSRVQELGSIGVRALELTGSHQIGRVRVFGKGCVGIVVKARVDSKEAALKIRRIDADRRDMGHEANMLRLANSVGVGPRLLAQSQNFLAMEFIDGVPLRQWVQLLRHARSKKRVRKVIARLFEDCYSLDQAHLDHGELSEAPKNVLIDEADNPHIVDFESASDGRRPSNVTSIAQYLLIGGGPAKSLRRMMKWRRRTSLIRALRDYKQHPDPERFLRIKTVVGVC